MQNNTPQEIWDVISKSKKPICCIDSRMDYDAFCSALLISELIEREFGVEVEITYTDDIPSDMKKKLSDLSKLVGKINFKLDPIDIDFDKYDLLIITDSGTKNHISADKDFKLPEDITIINIDHHNSNDFYGHYNYVFTYLSATAVLYDFIKKLNLKLDKRLATILSLGYLSDSGFLQYEGVRPDDYKNIAELMEDYGVVPSEVARLITFDESEDSIKCKQLVYKNASIDTDNRFVYSYITLDDFDEAGIDPKTKMRPLGIRGSDLLKGIDNTDYIFFIKQKPDNIYSVSFRSQSDKVDVSKIAEELNGGGHKMAAGGIVYDANSIREVVDKVIQAAKKTITI